MQKVQEKRQLVRKISEKFLNKQTNVPKNKLKIKRKKEVKITDIEMEQKNLQEEHNNLKRDIDKVFIIKKYISCTLTFLISDIQTVEIVAKR